MARVAPHEKLNRGAATGLDRATEQLPALTRAYTRTLKAAGRRAAARFRQTETVTAAANPSQPPAWTIPQTGSLIDTQQLADDTNQKTSKLHRTILDLSATEALKPFGISYDIKSVSSQTILDAYQTRIRDTIGDAIAEQVTEAIQTGYANGQSVAQVATAIQNATDDISPVRAAMLAQSDLNGLANAGSLLAATTSGAATTKTWTTAGDDRVRPDHEDAEGQTVPINGRFEVGGESCDHPGDPSLSWAEAANCRCVVTYGTAPLLAAAILPGEESPDAPKPGVLFLARHGLTEYDSDEHAKDTIRGWADDPLNDAGVAEAARLATNLKGFDISTIAASDLKRAADTATKIGGTLDLPVDVTDTLRPWNLGDFQGRTSDDSRDEIIWYVDHPNECVPGGESFSTFASRFLPVVADAMMAAENGGTPLLVTHSHNLKLARAWIQTGRAAVTGEQFMEPSPGPASVLAVEGTSVTEIMCDGQPTDMSDGSVPPRVHYRPATDPDRECGVCDFYRAGCCTMFDGDPAVIADYTCDEFVAKSPVPITSGGTMSMIDVERLTAKERAALRALLDAPLTPEQARMSAAREALAAKGISNVYDDAEITALFAIIDAEKPTVTLTDLDLTAAAAGGTQWTAILCVAGVPTVDGGVKRLLDPDSGSWLPLPRPLALLDDSPHADVTTKAPICGRIDQIWWAGNVCQASGVFFDDSDDPHLQMAGSKAAALVTELRGQLGVSVDMLPDFDFELMVWNGSSLTPIEEMDVANDPTARDYDGAEDPNAPNGPATEADVEEVVDVEEVEFVACISNWTISAATICPVQALTQATISIVAGGFRADGPSNDGYRWYTPPETFFDPPITASAAGLAPVEPPAEWFTVGEPDEPTPLTVTDDGQVFGHIGLWNSCHTAFTDRCVPPPKSPSDYAGFHLGEILTADGERVAVGTLTMDTGHADKRLGAQAAMAHYDHTGTAAAYVRATDGKHGIWVCGTLSARLDAADAQALMAAKPSGDWREIFRGKGRDMLGALMVNYPGFVVPRTLTASGMPHGDVAVEFSSDCAPCEAALDRELAVLAASADGIEALAALV